MRTRCPTCRREIDLPDDAPTRPFCSARCKLVDLGSWFDERYRIVVPMDDADERDELRPKR